MKPFKIWGDINKGLPTLVQATGSSDITSTALENPKSVIFTNPLCNKIFAGFKSLWMISIKY